MDSGYRKRVARNIFPLSVEQADLDVALAEWFYTGTCEDHEEPFETCQMCEQEGLRYHFLIANIQTRNALWVGSECILQFDMGAIDRAGVVVHGPAAEQIVKRDRQKLQDEARKERVLKTLRELWLKDKFQREMIESMVKYLKARGAFTPKQMLLIAARLQHHKVQHAPRDFKVILRRDREKAQVTATTFPKLSPYLSPEQRDRMAARFVW